jgi:hypothetical protein
LEGNADATQAHFQSVFYRGDNQVDKTVLDDIDPLNIDDATFQNTKSPPTNRVENAIYKMKNDTAPGITGVSADMLQNLPTESVQYIAELIRRNWNNQYNCPKWHTTTLTVLYKVKGK